MRRHRSPPVMGNLRDRGGAPAPAVKRAAQLRVGTSGWIYKEWAGVVYSAELKKGEELEYYSTQFNTVEINATFYRLPPLAFAKGWRRRTPKPFIFAVKGSRFITHLKRLRVRQVAIQKFFDRIRPLGRKCGPILWQLPPNFLFDPKRLETFLKKLPRTRRHAVEFRHPSWYENAESFDLLERFKAAHVSVSSLRMPMNPRVTTDFAYIRFHGLAGGPRHNYTRKELEPWAKHAADCLRKGCSVYAYFNNDLNTRAPWNAKDFRLLVERKTTHPSETETPLPRRERLRSFWKDIAGHPSVRVA